MGRKTKKNQNNAQWKKKERGGTSERRKGTEDTSLSQACLHVCWEEASAAQPMSLSLVSQPTSGNLHYGCSCVTPNSKNTLLQLLSLSPSNVRCRRHHSVGREDSPWRCRWASGCQRSWNRWAGSVTRERGKKNKLVIGSESKVTWLRLVRSTSSCCLCSGVRAPVCVCAHGAPEGCPCTTAGHFPECPGWSSAFGSGCCSPSPRCPRSRTLGVAGPSTALLLLAHITGTHRVVVVVVMEGRGGEAQQKTPVRWTTGGIRSRRIGL